MTETATEPITINSYVNTELNSLLPSIKDHTVDLQRLANHLKIPQDSRIVSHEEIPEFETLEKKAAVELTYGESVLKFRETFAETVKTIRNYTVVTLSFFIFLCACTRFAGYTPFWIKILCSGPGATCGAAMIIWFLKRNTPPFPERESVTPQQSEATMTSEELNRRQTDLLKIFHAINETNLKRHQNFRKTFPLVLSEFFILVAYIVVQMCNIRRKENAVLAFINMLIFVFLLAFVMLAQSRYMEDCNPQFKVIFDPAKWKCRDEKMCLKTKQKEERMNEKRNCKKCKKTVKK